MLRSSFFVALGILLCSSWLAAQKIPTATALNAGDCVAIVQVTDSQEKPIAGARVSLVGKRTSPSAAEFQLVETSDSKGRVRFAGLPHARLRLSAEAEGKQAQEVLDMNGTCAARFNLVIRDGPTL